MDKHLISFGHGYSAQALARRLLPLGWRISGTTRSEETAKRLRAEGITPLLWGGPDVAPALATASHLLTSVAPDAEGDPVLRHYAHAIATALAGAVVVAENERQVLPSLENLLPFFSASVKQQHFDDFDCNLLCNNRP